MQVLNFIYFVHKFVQLFAAMYAYYPHCRAFMEEAGTVIGAFQIGIMLAKW